MIQTGGGSNLFASVALFWKINLTKIRLPELWINGKKFLRRAREKAGRIQFVKVWMFCGSDLEDKCRSQ
jgi:hypothetical protein